MEGYQQGRGRGRMGGRVGEKVQGIRSIIGRYKIGGAKKSMGNGEAKELICMTYGNEIMGRGVQGRGD